MELAIPPSKSTQSDSNALRKPHKNVFELNHYGFQDSSALSGLFGIGVTGLYANRAADSVAAMDGAAIERAVEQLYAHARMDASVEADPLELASRLPGTEITVARGLPTRADTIFDGPARRTIRLRDGLDAAEVGECAGHEIAHALTDHQCDGVNPLQIEQICTRIGAAIVAPGSALRRLRREHGFDIAATARSLATTPLLVARRWIDVFSGESVALVMAHRIYRQPWDMLPADAALRAIVAAGGSRSVLVIPIAARASALAIAA